MKHLRLSCYVENPSTSTCILVTGRTLAPTRSTLILTQAKHNSSQFSGGSKFGNDRRVVRDESIATLKETEDCLII